MDKVFLSGIKVFGHHGHSDAERSVGVLLEVDIELRMDLKTAGETDHLADTADYGALYRDVVKIAGEANYHLLEKLASVIARHVLQTTHADEVVVRVAKPNPPVGGVCGSSAVEVARRQADFDSISQP